MLKFVMSFEMGSSAKGRNVEIINPPELKGEVGTITDIFANYSTSGNIYEITYRSHILSQPVKILSKKSAFKLIETGEETRTPNSKTPNSKLNSTLNSQRYHVKIEP